MYERLGYVACGQSVESWEAERPDGSVFTYETVVVQMVKRL